jgi:replicative DNA helicase
VLRRYSDQPEALSSQLQRLVADRRSRSQTIAEAPSELLELIPYMQALETRQRGNAYLGLDSGFEHLNNLCNGLDTGLFVLAAPPGEGKTTLAWQIGCQVAERGVPVLFVSFEQSKNELRAKVLARLSQLDYRHILRGRLQAGDQHNWSRVLEAALRYGQFANSITIVEGDENTTIADIRSKASTLKARNNAPRCLIIIDYLQIIPLEEDEKGRTSSPKEKVDLHVSALRRLARDLDSPIIAISSENRASYKAAKLDVFKESGIIEYSADIAAVMKRGSAECDSSSDGCRIEELRIVKNRNGECGVITFRFYAQHMAFLEVGRSTLPLDE